MISLCLLVILSVIFQVVVNSFGVYMNLFCLSDVFKYFVAVIIREGGLSGLEQVEKYNQSHD